MGNQDQSLAIGLHELSGLRWPRESLTGEGRQVRHPVRLPGLPWSKAAVEVPMGESAARAVDRVARLRRIFGLGIAPVILLIFVVADILLLVSVFADGQIPGAVFATFGIIGFALVLTGLVPELVARATGAPYVSRGSLRFPRTRPEAVTQLRKLNPKLPA